VNNLELEGGGVGFLFVVLCYYWGLGVEELCVFSPNPLGSFLVFGEKKKNGVLGVPVPQVSEGGSRQKLRKVQTTIHEHTHNEGSGNNVSEKNTI